MILESAILHVRTGQEINFERDFQKASQYISSIKGYHRHSLKKCLDQNNQYLLLVEWADVASHQVGFRKSDAYQEWKRLLHHYYDPFPNVVYYKTIFENELNT